MCGRFAINSSPDAMREFFGYDEALDFPPRYNIAPSLPVPVIRAERRGRAAPTRHVLLMRWGFLPGFVKDPKQYPLVFNARSESLFSKASFKNAMRRRRCLFMADAFYEWRHEVKGKPGRPYLLHRRDREPLAFAGLWETWMGPHGEELDTACIVTTAANGATAALHPRLPAIIEKKHFDLWLDLDETSTEKAYGLLHPPENDVLDFYEIGLAVNKAGHDAADIQVRVTPEERRAREQSVSELPNEPVQGSLF
ncbi:SOS response-associated peptidase [Beijerinckia indica]|uniref:Abasic site processing protein n=1 Tax=Beijerinckia indica subsp. indica (strain ATCC 9039 / DSM 1715 / NCIMB 8712) TaxID=395963 RepID=B2IF79_BEII9|nr:SOS response-associated peptidase [Beijerinckia indica]ACB95644.1 protein of unknown function DUF159 [Beijerinckia indica subsp. indica ATCC 9039]